MRSFLLYAFCMLYFIPSVAQGSLRGHVRHTEGGEIPVAIVKLLSNDSTSVVRYKRTSPSGDWIIDNLAFGQYILQVSALGFETWSRRVELFQPDTLTINIVLQEQAQTLQMIEISSRRIGLIERGDTLIYDLSYYLDSTEYDLKDILNKLPQMVVGEDGSIRYKGQRVNIILTEGRDIFGGMHKLMVESIKAVDVQGIQIIKNYRSDVEQHAKEMSDKVALNVQLTENAKRTLNGDASVGTDARQFAEGSVTTYRAGAKTGFSAIVKGNNTARALLGPLDFLSLIDLDDIQLKSGSSKLEELLPSVFSIKPDVQRNRDILVTFNLDATQSSRWDSKFNCYFLYADRRAESILFRNYIQENTTLLGSGTRRTSTNLLQARLKNDYKGNRRWAKHRLYWSSSNAPNQTLQEGTIGMQPMESNFSDSTVWRQIQTSLETGLNLDSGTVVKGRLQYRYFNQLNLLTSQAPYPIYGSADTILRQKNKYENTELNGELALQFHLFSHQMITSIGYTSIGYRHEASTWSSMPNSFGYANVWMRDNAGHIGAFVRREFRKYRYKMEAKVQLFNREFMEIPVGKRRNVVGELNSGFYCDFSKLHSLYFHFGYRSNLVPFNHLFRYNLIRDENSIVREHVDSFFIQRRAFMDVNYNLTLEGRYAVSFSSKWSALQHQVIYRPVFNGNYFVFLSLLAPSLREFESDFRGVYEIIPRKTQLSAVIAYNSTSGYVFRDDNLYALNTNTLTLAASFSFMVCNRLNGHVSNAYTSNIQHVEASGPVRFQQNVTDTGLSYQDNLWTIKLFASYSRQQYSLIPNDFWPLHFSLERRLSKPSMRLQLTGRNILNLKGNLVVLPDFGANHTGYSIFRTIGGQILMGVSWVF